MEQETQPQQRCGVVIFCTRRCTCTHPHRRPISGCACVCATLGRERGDTHAHAHSRACRAIIGGLGVGVATQLEGLETCLRSKSMICARMVGWFAPMVVYAWEIIHEFSCGCGGRRRGEPDELSRFAFDDLDSCCRSLGGFCTCELEIKC